jgi:hypothetical protein
VDVGEVGEGVTIFHGHRLYPARLEDVGRRFAKFG